MRDRKWKKVLIIGGGEAAFDYSLSLAEQASEVNILIRDNKPKAMGKLVGIAGNEPLITVSTDVQPVGVEDSRHCVRLHCIRQGTAIVKDADAILVAIGRKSAITRIMPDWKPKYPFSLSAGRNLYIVGDARLGSTGQVAIASGDGIAAAQEIAQNKRK